MYCKYCGGELDDNSIFCRHCGRPLDSVVVDNQTKLDDDFTLTDEIVKRFVPHYKDWEPGERIINDYLIYCPNCKKVSPTYKRISKGSCLLELVLWMLFIIPGLLYSIWRRTNRDNQVCPVCNYPYFRKLDFKRTWIKGKDPLLETWQIVSIIVGIVGIIIVISFYATT